MLYQIASSLKTSKPTKFLVNLLLNDKKFWTFVTDYLQITYLLKWVTTKATKNSVNPALENNLQPPKTTKNNKCENLIDLIKGICRRPLNIGQDSVQNQVCRLKKIEKQKQPENKNKGFVVTCIKKITFINIYLAH